MLKAFISHSSKQKENFVVPLVELLGRDSCIVDAYDFDAAYKSLDEIYKNIEECTVFVFLVTKESLESEWCKKELERSYQKLSAGDKMRFWPFIIDEEVDIKDTPEWIHKTDCYNLKYFKTPKALAREIEQKFRTIIWKENPALQRKETLLVGRNSDIDLFENKYFSARRNILRAVIISGRVGVGKEAFANQCMQKIGKDVETIPFRLSLSAKNGVEDFILGLNAITGTYSEEQMKEIVLPSSVNEKSHYAVLLLNELYSLRTVLYLQDDMCFVLPNRKLPEWFIDIIKDKELNSQIGLFILSRLTPITTIESIFPEIISIVLGPLSKSDRRKLFYQLLAEYKISNIAEKDVEKIIEKLNQSPVQLIQFAESLRTYDFNLVEEDMESYIHLGDRKLKPLYDMFSDGDEKELIIVLSKFDFISFNVLERIYGEEYRNAVACVHKLIVNGLASTFGPSSCFVRLDSALSDFIKRNHIKLPTDFENAINDVLDDYLTDNPNMETDLSIYLYDIKKRILSGRTTDKDYLIPSVVVKSILELYNSGDYDEVIRLCKYILREFDNYDTDVVREIRYWLCLALCRKQQSDDFYNEVNNFDGADYKFLRGFYYRIEGRPDLAEKFYLQALDIAPAMQKLKREYVSALLEQRKFTEALEKAKENYESAQENTYHIHAYFRSLIKKTPLTRTEILELESLIKQVGNSYSPKKIELVYAMQLEYDIIVAKKSVNDILTQIGILEAKFPKSHDIGRVINEFKFKQGLIKQREKFMEEYYY